MCLLPSSGGQQPTGSRAGKVQKVWTAAHKVKRLVHAYGNKSQGPAVALGAEDPVWSRGGKLWGTPHHSFPEPVGKTHDDELELPET